MKTLALIFLSTLAFAKIAVEKPVKEKLSCTARELSRRDCQLRSGKLKVSLHHGKWHFTDGVTVAVHDLPSGEAQVTWKSASLKIQGGRRLIEFKAWLPGKGEAELQNLTWYLVEIHNQAPVVHVAEVVQRRRPKTGREPASFQTDAMEKHGLRFAKSKFHWHAGRRQGEF